MNAMKVNSEERGKEGLYGSVSAGGENGRARREGEGRGKYE